MEGTPSIERLAATVPHARKRRGTLGWDVLMGLNVALIAVTGILGVAAYLRFLATGEPVLEEREAGPDLLWLTNIWNLFVFGLIPLVWVMGTRARAWRGTLGYLHLRRPWPAALQGVGHGALLAGIVILLLVVLDATGFPFEDTGSGARFVGITWGLAVLTSLIAGFAEEIFFRGVLQRWIGVWGQAVVFGSFHLQGGWMAFVITGSIGLFFGFLVKRGRPLWLVIMAHAAYNMVLFSLGFLLEEPGDPLARLARLAG